MVTRRRDPFAGADTAALWARVQERVEVTPDGCWLWLGALNRDGYGSMRTGVGNAVGQPHRLAVIVRDGAIPQGLEVDHRCHDSHCHETPCPHRRCVNPEHLATVTHRANLRRHYEDGRCRQGHVLTMRPDGLWRECLVCRAARRATSPRGRTITPGPLDRPLFQYPPPPQ